MKLMKKIINLFVLAMVLLVNLSSCTQEDEHVYSCNKNLDSWIKENLPSIQSMSRKDWLRADSTTTIALYRAFTPQQRVKFWKEKLNEVKTLKWSEKELLHIQKIEDFVNAHTEYFDGKDLTDDQLDSLELFSYQWTEYAITTLGWSKQLCGSIIGTGKQLKNKKGELVATSVSSHSNSRITKLENCDCSVTSDWCGIGWYCKDTDCDTDNFGCGFLLLYNCDGNCH